MNGQLIITFFGVNDGYVSSATSTRHIHGSWFNTMDDVNKAIAEEKEQEGFHSADWESWD